MWLIVLRMQRNNRNFVLNCFYFAGKKCALLLNLWFSCAGISRHIFHQFCQQQRSARRLHWCVLFLFSRFSKAPRRRSPRNAPIFPLSFIASANKFFSPNWQLVRIQYLFPVTTQISAHMSANLRVCPSDVFRRTAVRTQTGSSQLNASSPLIMRRGC